MWLSIDAQTSSPAPPHLPSLTDESRSVREAILVTMPPLALFFGRQITNDILLSHMITFLNDADWRLRR